MIPALYIKEDGKIYLIPDCPEHRSYCGGKPYCCNGQRCEVLKYQEQLEQAKASAILVDNQEYGMNCIQGYLGVDKWAEFPKIDTVYPMPKLKYIIEEEYRKWTDDAEKFYEITAILEEPVKQEIAMHQYSNRERTESQRDRAQEMLNKHYVLDRGLNNPNYVINAMVEFANAETTKQKEQEESQDKLWRECLSMQLPHALDIARNRVPGDPTDLLIERIKRHFKIERLR